MFSSNDFSNANTDISQEYTNVLGFIAGGGSEIISSLLETAGLPVAALYFRDFALFSVCSSEHYSSAN
jgi:hypothetical protein